jgi:hypothetical protein
LNIASGVYKKEFDALLKTYLSPSDSAGTLVRQLKKTPTDTRGKLTQELRSLDKKQLELLDQLDNLAKST